MKKESDEYLEKKLTEIREIVCSIPVFSSCKEEELKTIEDNSEIIDFNRGEHVFVSGDKPDSFYSIIAGQVVIKKNDDQGHPVDIARFVEGDYFGESDVFNAEDRNASAVANMDSRILFFPSRDKSYASLRHEYPSIGTRLLHRYLVQLSERIRSVNNLVKEKSKLVNGLRHQTYVDKLTGLFNKTCFEESLSKLLDNREKTLAILWCKPDNFKEINDTYGHEIGDKVLRHIADLLSDFVPDRTMLFRYQGNENAIILPEFHREEAMKMAKKIRQFYSKLRIEKFIQGKRMLITASIGVTLYPLHGKDLEGLSTYATLPLEARRRGGNMILLPEDVS